MVNAKIEFLSDRLTELEREFEGHVFDYRNQDTGTTLCRHLSHVSGWSSTCPKAAYGSLIRAQLAAQRELIAEYHEAEAYYDEHPDAPAGELTGLKNSLEIFVQAFRGHVDFPAEWKR